jgi:hypothetical protein
VACKCRRNALEPFIGHKEAVCSVGPGGLRKTRHRGLERVGWMFIFTAAAYNLIRLSKLLGA